MLMKDQRKTTAFRLPLDLRVRIDDMALQHELTRTAIIESLLRHALNMPAEAPVNPLKDVLANQQ